MVAEPCDNSGATNKAREDASAGRKANTQNWSDAQRQTYESVHKSTQKSG